MSVLLDVGRVAAVANVGLLVALAYVWGSAYRRHRASHTLGLLVFATVLFVQNLLWIYAYVFHEQFIGWFYQGDVSYQLTITALCGLQTIALLALVRITWQ